jgi:hypothetical protein
MVCDPARLEATAEEGLTLPLLLVRESVEVKELPVETRGSSSLAAWEAWTALASTPCLWD